MADSDNPPSASPVRLNKYLALQLGISRREADNLIEKGKVRLNGSQVELGGRFKKGDIITIAGQPVNKKVGLQYVIFYKPVGYVCSRQAQGDAPTIYALLPSSLHHLKTAGRLDKDSSGLLLLTNDGDFAFQMTHPKFNKTKQYEVSLGTDLAPLHQQMISDYGVALADGTSRLRLEKPDETSRKNWRVLMHEGRNRQIRRTFAALGYTVTRLHRTDFGNYSLGDMRSGEYRTINIS